MEKEVLCMEKEAERINEFLTREERREFENDIANCSSPREYINIVKNWINKVEDREDALETERIENEKHWDSNHGFTRAEKNPYQEV